MKHQVIFRDQPNQWDTALPLGNGVFGCMLFYDKGQLSMPMNHYEVYYNISKAVLPKDKLASYPADDGKGRERHQKIHDLADANIPAPGEPYCDYTYRKDRRLAMEDPDLGLAGFSNSYPCTGELVFAFDPALTGKHHTLILDTEEATVRFHAQAEDLCLDMDTVTANEDCILNRVKQSREGLVKSIFISFPEYRDYVYPRIEYRQLGKDLFTYTVTRQFEGKDEPFVFSGILRLLGAEGCLEEGKNGAYIRLERSGKEFTLLTGIFTDWNYADPAADGIQKTAAWVADLPGLYRAHRTRWEEFFSRSAIQIPDKFLEHVYYVNQYALGCCSGKDGVMKHHACGLNGLWAIRHPNLWGSMWYWDVNIQAAFAGVFSSNRLDLGKVFSDGLRSYTDLMEWYARYYHGMEGYSADYPYNFYYCVVPWCAMYLWYQYEYSQDKEYLRQEAYPFFLKLCEFVTQLFEYDPKDDTYHVYPDISPEQGPLAHDTTITVATCKYLLKYTLEAARILEDDHPLLEKCAQMLAKMPPYAISGPGICGPHLMDSPDAPENMFIRHPSMLMPLFPIGEFDRDSDLAQVLSNTVDYLEERCEIGIFGGSWLAAAAARLGRGQTALRLLYEKGIDHMLRANGLTAEETERFMNYCLILRQPLYYPCMMEFTGEMLAAVNEMLLQSENGLIRVFPALPDGDPEYGRLLRNGHSYHVYPDRYVPYVAWEDVRFDKLLAKGAFAISASLQSGKVAWITLLSKAGGTARITSPLSLEGFGVYSKEGTVPFALENGIFTFATEPGTLYWLAPGPEIDTAMPEEAPAGEILSRETYTRRHIYIGLDPEVIYQRQLDDFIRDRYLGNMRLPNHTVYKFDFGTDANKDYKSIFRRQSFAAEERMLLGMGPVFVKDLRFTPRQGYGFADDGGLEVLDRGAPDGLRRDFVQGDTDAEFLIEVPRGQYELLAVSGDAEEASVTCLSCEHGPTTGGEIIPAGRWQCKVLPLVLEEDGCIRLRLSTKPGHRWKLNYLFLNCTKGY